MTVYLLIFKYLESIEGKTDRLKAIGILTLSKICSFREF